MKTDKKVFNKLFSNEKVELATQKFEFGVIDVILKEKDKASDTFYSAVVLINNARNNAEDILKNAMLFANGNLEKIAEAKKMSKDLGIEIPKTVLDAEISASNILKKAQSGIAMLKKIDL
jgi:hypothetical protein